MKKRNLYKEFFSVVDDTLDEQQMEIEEAQLLNSITDYEGGVQYVMRDPKYAKQVAKEIAKFAKSKKIYPVEYKKSKSGKVGYFYFRIGDDPAKESQQLQGYFSQKPEIKHFRFKRLNK